MQPPTLGQRKLTGQRYIEIDTARLSDIIAACIAVGPQLLTVRVTRKRRHRATAPETCEIEPCVSRGTVRVHTRNYIGPVGPDGSQRNVCSAVIYGDRLTCVEAQDRRNLPIGRHSLGETAAEPRSDGNERKIKDMAALKVAVRLLGSAVIRVLIIVPSQFAAKIVRANAVRSGVIRQQSIVVRKTMIQGKEQRIVISVSSVIGLHN